MEVYQEDAFEAYFGEFYGEYEQQVESLLELPWSTVEHCMDDEIRERLHAELAPCDNRRFLLAYIMEHTSKFGEDFIIG